MAHETRDQMTPDDAPGPSAEQHRCSGEIFLTQRQKLRAYAASEACPIDQPEDDGNAEVVEVDSDAENGVVETEVSEGDNGFNFLVLIIFIPVTKKVTEANIEISPID